MSNSLPFAKKSLGQHFLICEKVIKSITEDFQNEYKSLIEVGPGPAILTKNLSSISCPKVVVERDNRFKPLLQQYLNEEEIFMTDALSLNWNELIQIKGLSSPTWLVSNLPYNISVPLTINFIQEEKIKYMTLMVQKEVGQKMLPSLAGKKIQKARGSLSCLCENYFEVSSLIKVSPGCFNPPPKVDSIVLSFKRKSQPIIPLSEFESFESFCRRLYANRRKQVGKVLSKYYQKEFIEKAFESLNINLIDRAEIFSLETVQHLYNKFKSCSKDTQ